jgi:hypothetical protein
MKLGLKFDKKYFTIDQLTLFSSSIAITQVAILSYISSKTIHTSKLQYSTHLKTYCIVNGRVYLNQSTIKIKITYSDQTNCSMNLSPLIN